MEYIIALSWLIAIWLGSAWTEGLIGIWGMWVAFLIGGFWLAITLAAKFISKERGKEND